MFNPFVCPWDHVLGAVLLDLATSYVIFNSHWDKSHNINSDTIIVTVL